MAASDDLHHGVVVCGGGLIGLAAALASARDGADVTLLDLRGELAWEVSRALACVARPEGAEWAWLCDPLEKALPRDDQLAFPAWIEIAASRLLHRLGVKLRYFARPIAAWREGETLVGLRLASKSGTGWITAARWIDATETGEVAALIDELPARRQPMDHVTTVLMSANRWHSSDRLLAGEHADDRLLRITHPAADGSTEILDALSGVGEEAAEARLVSLLGYRALPRYISGKGAAEPFLHGNVVIAGIFAMGGLDGSPEERIRLGRQAAALKGCSPAGRPGAPRPDQVVRPDEIQRARVAVAGAGTGGAVAAIASAKAGAATVCVDLFPFPGGTTVASGIHAYWYGVSGGLQEEIDDLVQEATPLVGAVKQMRGYHPDLRRLVLARLFARHGVRFAGDALLFDVSRTGDRIDAALLATDRGVVRLEADQWIDSTGDGDLCALAGARFRFGRESDGIASPYTQSGTWLTRTAKHWYLGEINYDSGWLDPTDPEDLTRARVEGLEQLAELAAADEDGRLIASSPMVGLRQSRQFETETMLSLDDLVRRRKHDDAVGHVGAHFDNHMLDYYLESRDAIFWVWCARQWRTPLACELPLGAMQPRGLGNVLLACRAFGVSRDAHHALRMMRDMHRLGEVAGNLAALGGGTGAAMLSGVRERLAESGAILPHGGEAAKQTRFGPDSMAHVRQPTLGTVADAEADLRAGRPTGDLWLIYKDEPAHGGAVLAALASNDAKVSWIGSCIAGLWGSREAETRLLAALESREAGEVEATSKFCTDPAFRPFPPNWVAALTILGFCGGERAGRAIVHLLEDSSLMFDLRVAAVRALTGTVERGFLPDAAMLKGIAHAALNETPPGSFVRPQQYVIVPDELVEPAYPRQVHDMRWKLTLAFVQLFEALGEPDALLSSVLQNDPRVFVRHARSNRNPHGRQ